MCCRSRIQGSWSFYQERILCAGMEREPEPSHPGVVCRAGTAHERHSGHGGGQHCASGSGLSPLSDRTPDQPPSTRSQFFHWFQTGWNLTWCIMNCDLLVFIWFSQPGCLYVERISERHWPLIKQPVTPAAQTAPAEDSLRCRPGRAGSPAPENGSSGKGCCVIFQVLSQRSEQESGATSCHHSINPALLSTRGIVMKTPVPPSSYECILHQTVMPFHRDNQEKTQHLFFFAGGRETSRR